MKDINALFSFLHEKLSNGEEKEKLINSLLDESSHLKMTAFKNSVTGEVLTLGEFIKREGREKAAELIEQLLNSILDGSGAIEKQVVSADEFKEIHEKVQAGTANEEEKVVHDVIIQTLQNSGELEDDSQKLITIIMETLIDITRFCNEDVNYNAPLSDLAIAFDLYTTATMALDPKSALHKFVGCEPSTFSHIGQTVCADIMKACIDFWKEKGNVPKPEFIILGLVNYLMVLCAEFNIPNFKEISKFFNFESDENSEEKEKPEVVQPVCHGSNSNIVPFTTEEAKDLLKDD